MIISHQLETFIRVAESGSFSRAAEALFITPSAVIQQINNLESDLQVQLFQRTRHGTALTSAGAYLYREAGPLIQRGKEIQETLVRIDHQDHSRFHVGTSLLYKCRLFYDLWLRYSECCPEAQVDIINLTQMKEADKADLIEGIADGEPWQQKRQFLPLSSVPIACAVARSHPLAGLKKLTFEAMRPYTLVTIRSHMSEELDRLAQDAEAHSIHVEEVKAYDLSVFSRCIVNHTILQTPLCWKDIHPDLITLPCEWSYALPYGFHFKPDAGPSVQAFLDFVRKLKTSEVLHL